MVGDRWSRDAPRPPVNPSRTPLPWSSEVLDSTGPMAPFGFVLGLSLLVLAVIRGVNDDLRSRGQLSEGTANVVAAAFLLDAMIVFVAAGGHVAAMPLSETPALVIGWPVLLAGLFITGAACQALDSRERLLGVRIDAVVSTGAYRFSRHPFYIGSSLTLLGAAIAGQSWFALGLATATAVFLAVLARREERVLLERMPDAYSAYRGRTRPLFGRAQSPSPSSA